LFEVLSFGFGFWVLGRFEKVIEQDNLPNLRAFLKTYPPYVEMR
jgi:hypothetical protein